MLEKSVGYCKIRTDGTCFRDKDSNLFIVLGYIHPLNISYSVLKYSSEEKKDSRRFLQAKGVNDYEDAVNFLRFEKPHYIDYSPFYDTDLLAIPHSDVGIVYDGVQKLEEIVESPFSRIEETCSSFCKIMTDNLGLKLTDIGVRGSILYGTPRPDSDIDLTIFGKTNMKYFQDHIGERPEIAVMPPLEVERVSKLLHKISPLSMEEIVEHVVKRKTKLEHLGLPISIKCVRSEREIRKDIPKFNNVSCKTFGPVTAQGIVLDSSSSCCYPVEYRIKDFDRERDVEQILCFESLFAEFVDEGDLIEVKGVLQEVKLDKARKYKRIVLSTRELAGKEYVKRIDKPRNEAK